jgi:hypothetical protein
MTTKKDSAATGVSKTTRGSSKKPAVMSNGEAVVKTQSMETSIVSEPVAQQESPKYPCKEQTMSDDNVSIIEFSDDIATAEAPEPLPVGVYPADIKGVAIKESAKGTKYAAVSFYVSPDDYPVDYPLENAPDGTTLVYRRISLEDNPGSRFRLRQFIESIGAVASKRIDVTEWIGLTARVSVVHDEYEGIKRSQIDKVLSP